MNESQIARRALLTSAGLGFAAGLAGTPIPAARANPAPADIWSHDYWAHKGDVKLNLWRKRVGAPKPGEPPLPVLFLVHGSSLSARSSYDLTVPGNGEYSLMNVFAGYGYDVWTMDHDGYGYSGSSGNNSDIASGVEDLKAAMEVLRAKPAAPSFTSSAIRRARYGSGHSRRASPTGSIGSFSPPPPTRAKAPLKFNAGATASPSCAPIRGASATPP